MNELSESPLPIENSQQAFLARSKRPLDISLLRRETYQKEAQLFLAIYRDIHKDDQWGIVRQVGACLVIGGIAGCSLLIPLYALYKGIHATPMGSDIVPNIGLGGAIGAASATYKSVLSSAVRRWSTVPRPL